MFYQLSDIVEDVKIILDENRQSDQLAGTDDNDTLSLDEIIMTRITGAAEEVAKLAPARLLGIGYPFADEITWRYRPGYGPGYTVLPHDFMRLITFQMSDWSRPVTRFITEDDPLYLAQQSRFPGIRGNPQRPVVAIIPDAANLILEFYSCAAGANVHVRKARYLPYPRVKDGGLEIPKRIYQAILYYTAAQSLVSLSQTDLAGTMFEISKNKLQQ